MKRSIALILCVLMLAAFIPARETRADDRTEISSVVASSNIYDILYKNWSIQHPTFTVTEGAPAYINTRDGFGYWWKKEEGTWVNKTGIFSSGTWRYTAQLRIDSGGDAYVLASKPTLEVDGVTWTVSGTSSITSTISYVSIQSPEFTVGDEVPIRVASVMVTAPEVGAKPDFSVQLPDDANFFVGDFCNEIYQNDVCWFDRATRDYLTPEDEFQSGHQYRVRVNLTAKAGYMFIRTSYGTINWHEADLFYSANGMHTTDVSMLGLEYFFPALPEVGWQKKDGKWYYYDEEGASVTGWKQIEGKWYYFNSSGVMQTSWLKQDGKWYYLDASGAMVTGWKQIGGKWYWFNGSGVMVTGWKQIGGKWYWFNSSGVMQTGLKKIDGKWYYFESGGAMYATAGWKQIGSRWYYFDVSGAAQVGWKQIGGKWYYFDASAVMVTSWQKIGGKWYYFNSSGVMQTGWQKINNKWYWFDNSGVMAANCTKTINGKSYTFDSSGVCTNP